MSFLLATAIFVPQVAVAQSLEQYQPADTSSPRATLQSFLESCNELHRRIRADRYFDRTSGAQAPLARRILDCLDTEELAEFERLQAATEAAACLKEILDRFELPPESEIPGTAEIEAAGGFEALPRWRIPGTRITIARVEEGPRQHEYLFSPGTVRQATEYYDDVKALPYRTTGPEVSPGLYEWYFAAPGDPTVAAVVDRLPVWWRSRGLGLARWQWAGLLVATPLALLLMAAAWRLHLRLADAYRDQSLPKYCLTIVIPIAATLVPLGFAIFVRDYLTVRGTALSVIKFSADLAALSASLVVIFGISSRIAAVVIASPRINPQGLDAQFIRIFARLTSVVLGVIVFLEGGHHLGIPITTLVASAGVGGLAVALAAQDTLKNLFGTVMLLTDKPFRVGERIVFNDYDGVVEEIGLRSTRLRLLTGHQVTIPNDELSRTDIENVGRRPYIRRVADIRLPLDTPRSKLEQAVAAVRRALENHAGMNVERPPRVYFFDFESDAFVIRAMYWYAPPDYWDFLALGEQINLEIFRAFEELGVSFSLPFRVTHTSLESRAQPVEVRLLDEQT